MNNQAKLLYEKMTDFKRFAVILLTVGVFFYLGVIIPSDMKDAVELQIMMVASTAFIAVSLLFFIQSKLCRAKLIELEEDEDKFMK